MAGISDRLRAAMERLDQAVDRLETNAATESSVRTGSPTANPPTAALAERLDRMIERIESALAG